MTAPVHNAFLLKASVGLGLVFGLCAFPAATQEPLPADTPPEWVGRPPDPALREQREPPPGQRPATGSETAPTEEALKRAADLIERAEQHQRDVFGVISAVGNIAAVVLGVLTVLLTTLSVWATFKGRQIARISREAKKLARRVGVTAEKAQRDAAKARRQSRLILEMNRGAQVAFQALEEEADSRLERLDQALLDNEPLEVSDEEAQTWEDFDTIAVVLDRLEMPSDRARRARLQMSMARYWRATKQFSRAFARDQRAVALEPDNPAAFLALGKTLCAWCAGLPPSPRKTTLGERALQEIAKAEAFGLSPPAGVPHYRGWALDELDRLDEAITAYRQAIALDDRAVSETGSTPHHVYRYNLACALSRAGGRTNLREAWEQLCRIKPFGKFWEMASRDPDLKRLRRSRIWKQPCPRRED